MTIALPVELCLHSLIVSDVQDYIYKVCMFTCCVHSACIAIQYVLRFSFAIIVYEGACAL